MGSNKPPQLSRRERQIMDVIYTHGQATVGQIRDALAEPPSYSAVRALVGILVDKGHLKFKRDGIRYVYMPTRTHRHAGRSAMRHALDVFYGGDIDKAVAALLDVGDTQLSQEDRKRILLQIDKARKEGR